MACCALMAASAALATPKPEAVAAYRVLVKQDQRLATVGYQLARSNAAFCRDTIRNPGWVLHDERQYPDLATARAAFVFRQPVSISALVPGSPAGIAGMAVGDGPVWIGSDTQIWYGGEPVRHVPTVERLENVKKTLAKALSENPPLVLTMATREGDRIFKLDPPLTCASEFEVDPNAKTDAGADGNRVRITSGLMEFTPDDNELAAVVAHELAHNLLGHPALLTMRRKNKTIAIREAELQADRLSVWLMANAGYAPDAAVTFWQRYGPRQSKGIFGSRTHPHWKKRVLLLQQEMALLQSIPEIAGKRQPPLLQKTQ